MNNKVLIIAPHTDDGELGCGGTIARYLEEGREIHIAAFSTCEESLPEGLPDDTLKKEFYHSMAKYEIPVEQTYVYDYPVRRLSNYRQEVLDELIKLRNTIQPGLVFIPTSEDLHQDHQIVYNEGIRAFKYCSVFGYELPWNHLSFDSEAFIILNENHVAKKWEVLTSYKTQLEMNRPYFNKDFIYGLAKVRGAQVGKEWAESFKILRLVN
jgi:N-acetylglucosamine malate deacetylase 1